MVAPRNDLTKAHRQAQQHHAAQAALAHQQQAALAQQHAAAAAGLVQHQHQAMAVQQRQQQAAAAAVGTGRKEEVVDRYERHFCLSYCFVVLICFRIRSVVRANIMGQKGRNYGKLGQKTLSAGKILSTFLMVNQGMLVSLHVSVVRLWQAQ